MNEGDPMSWMTKDSFDGVEGMNYGSSIVHRLSICEEKGITSETNDMKQEKRPSIKVNV